VGIDCPAVLGLIENDDDAQFKIYLIHCKKGRWGPQNNEINGESGYQGYLNRGLVKSGMVG
jgi:hypothetical protein